MDGVLDLERLHGQTRTARLHSRGGPAARRPGTIHINDRGIADEPMTPFGGVKDSGYGKFGGTAGGESFTEQSWLTVQHTGRASCPF